MALRPWILAAALAAAAACGGAQEVPAGVQVTLTRPLLLRPVEDPAGVLGRIARAGRDDPAAGIALEEALVGGAGRPAVQEVFPTGPSRQVLEDFLRAHPELAAPAGHDFAYERIDGRDGEGERWRLHCLRGRGGLEVRRAEAAEVFDDLGGPRIRVRLGADDGQAFARLTAENVGARLAVVHDGEVLMAPVVQEAITGGTFDISPGGRPTRAEAEALLRRLLGA